MTVRKASLSVRAMASARYPAAASVCAMESPSPRLAPVTITLRIGAHQFSGSRYLERWHDPHHGRDLMRGEHPATLLDDVVRDRVIRRPPGALGRGVIEHHLRGHHRAGDRAAPCLYQGHPHPGVRVDDRFHFLRMHLEAADVDDASASTHEVIAAVTQLEAISRVYEAVRVLQRWLLAEIPG